MILTQCAVCATELGLTLGKKCGRCSTRYCGPECQVQHWKEGGHDTLCKKIKKAGGAEQYNANKKYAEAVSVAVEKCAEDTKGQTCYICLGDWKTKEGLVRGCACRGTAGFAHVSCLAEQAKILVTEGEENNLSLTERWARWSSCGLCKQEYHGGVACALGWACWKTYVGRPEGDVIRGYAMGQLANGLGSAQRHVERLEVYKAHVEMHQRFAPDDTIGLIGIKSYLAGALDCLKRFDDALILYRELMDHADKHMKPESDYSLRMATNFGRALMRCAATQPGKKHLFSEARSLLRDRMPLAERSTGLESRITLQFCCVYANATILDIDCPIETILEVKSLVERRLPTMRRVLGASHPMTEDTEGMLRRARKVVDIRENLGELEELEESEELLSREDFVEKLRKLEMKSEARKLI